MARFEDVLTIINGKNQKKVENPNGVYPIYGSGGIMGYADDYICEANSVVIGRKGSINNPIFVETRFWNVDTAFGLYADSRKLEPKYLYYFCKNYDFERLNTTVTIPSLTKSNLLKVEIPLPSLNEQCRIAAILDKVTDLISKRRQQLDKLDELVKARFVEMFGDPVCDSHKYQKVPLGTVANVGSSKRIFEKEYVSDGVPFYRTKEIVELAKGHKITTELFISKKRFNEICEEYGKPQKGDLLISAVGTIGVIWIVDGKNDFYFKDGNLLRVAFSNRFDPVYLKILLESLIAEYKKKMAAGTAYAALTISILKEIPTYLVPLDEQRNFSTFVEQTEKAKATISQSLEKLETLKKALMQEYFG